MNPLDVLMLLLYAPYWIAAGIVFLGMVVMGVWMLYDLFFRS